MSEHVNYYQEPFRPQYHFTPEKNWMNDPNGMFYFAGEYHLFYQYNPFGDKWGHMSWGHAVSPDMLHWQHLPLALAEENGEMIFSGSAVVDWNNSSGLGANGQPPLIAIYTGHVPGDVVRQYQCLGYSNDKGRTWTKYSGNPVLDIGKSDFRDPKVFYHEATHRWIMTLALSDIHKISFYASTNLKNWIHLSDFGPRGSAEGLWECPDLFELPVDGDPQNTRWVLQVDVGSGSVSGGSGGQYFVGNFDGTAFHADPASHPDEQTPLWIDYGKDYYATVSWSDIPESDGRRLWLGWMSNWQYAQEVPTAPWRSAQSIPREVTLCSTPEGLRLVQGPVKELKALRDQQFRLENLAISPGAPVDVSRQLSGNLLEIIAEFAPGNASEFGIRVRKGINEETLIGYDVQGEKLFVDRSKSGHVGFHKNFSGRHSGPLKPADGHIKLHIFVDIASVEVFGNDGRIVITEIIFPSPQSSGVEFFANDGEAVLVSLEGWKLKPAVPGSLK